MKMFVTAFLIMVGIFPSVAMGQSYQMAQHFGMILDQGSAISPGMCYMDAQPGWNDMENRLVIVNDTQVPLILHVSGGTPLKVMAMNQATRAGYLPVEVPVAGTIDGVVNAVSVLPPGYRCYTVLPGDNRGPWDVRAVKLSVKVEPRGRKSWTRGASYTSNVKFTSTRGTRVVFDSYRRWY